MIGAEWDTRLDFEQMRNDRRQKRQLQNRRFIRNRIKDLALIGLGFGLSLLINSQRTSFPSAAVEQARDICLDRAATSMPLGTIVDIVYEDDQLSCSFATPTARATSIISLPDAGK